MTNTFRRVALGAVAACSVLAAGAAFAQTSDGSDYRPLSLNSPDNAQVQADAVAASHASGTESIGQSTSAVIPASMISLDEVQRGAMAAARPAGTESIGQSTAMPMPVVSAGS